MGEFTQRLLGPEFAVTLEITPPKKRIDEVLLRRARLLGGLADAVNVIQRPGSACRAWMRRSYCVAAGLEPVCHVVEPRSQRRPRRRIRARQRCEAHGWIPCFACVATMLPDGSQGHAEDPRRWSCLARAAHPGWRDRRRHGEPVRAASDRVLANLAPKLEAGAGIRVQTNPVFDVEPASSPSWIRSASWRRTSSAWCRW